MAAQLGHLEALSLLLSEFKMDVNYQETQQFDTALHVAVRHGRLGCTKLLLEAGADTSVISVRASIRCACPSPSLEIAHVRRETPWRRPCRWPFGASTSSRWR